MPADLLQLGDNEYEGTLQRVVSVHRQFRALHHGLPLYPNLAREITRTGLDQLWVADITYIRLELEFVYLAEQSCALGRRRLTAIRNRCSP